MHKTLPLGVLAASLLAWSSCSDASDHDAPAAALAQTSGGTSAAAPASDHFSFFVASQRALQELSGSQDGFGGDFRFGETGEGAGLRGADKICATIAEDSLPGSGKKGWRAFLSATRGGADGGPVHAIDRVGAGPWYDRVGRLIARDKIDLAQMRPRNADPSILRDLPNEDGVPNHAPDGREVDNHHVLTGSNEQGKLYRNDPRVTCEDWTTSRRDRADAPRVGLSWPRGRPGGTGGFPWPPRGDGGVPSFPGFPGFPSDGGVPSFPGFPAGGGFRLPDGGTLDPFSGPMAEHWISALDESGCAPGGNIVNAILPDESIPTVGSGGGYGAIYCFALKP